LKFWHENLSLPSLSHLQFPYAFTLPGLRGYAEILLRDWHKNRGCDWLQKSRGYEMTKAMQNAHGFVDVCRKCNQQKIGYLYMITTGLLFPSWNFICNDCAKVKTAESEEKTEKNS
jgi:hypothetical protein